MWSFPSASLCSARRARGTHVVACSVWFVTLRAVCVAWTHMVSLSMLPTVDVRAVASFLFKQNKQDSSCISLLASSHAQWGNCWGLGYRCTQLCG